MKTRYPCLWFTLCFVLASASSGTVIMDPPLAFPPGAIDPVAGPSAGRQTITRVAEGAATKAELEAVAGLRVIQRFEGFRGARLSPSNEVRFSEPGMPAIRFTINATQGYGGTGAAPTDRAAYTSGKEPPRAGEAIYIGDNVNETRYEIEFSEPVKAVGFTVARRGATTGAMPVWAAAFYDEEGRELSRQNALVGHGANEAVLFGHVAKQGLIRRAVFGKLDAQTTFVMGNQNTFLDDVAFAPAGKAVPVHGVVRNPPTGKRFGEPGNEVIDLAANGATPRSFLEALPGFMVVRGWEGFEGKGASSQGVNFIEFDQAPDFRFELVMENSLATDAGGVTSESALATSGGQAIGLGGAEGFRGYMITLGRRDRASGVFAPESAVYALGFVLTGVGPKSHVVATFYNPAGEVLSVQNARGMEDPANRDQLPGLRGVEIYFGHMAETVTDMRRWIHRVTIEGTFEGQWGFDDLGFAGSP